MTVKRDHRLAQGKSAIVGGNLLVGQHLEALRPQIFSQEVQQQAVLEAAAGESYCC